MALSLSQRAEIIVRSEIRNMSVECERVGGINLSQGVCDTEVPRVIRDGAHAAIEAGVNSYTRHDGLADLRQAIARKLQAHNGIKANPESEVVVTAGSTGAFYCACLALLNPGDEVVLFEPYYGYHLNTLLAASLVPKYVPLSTPGWNIDGDALRRAVTSRTRAVMICTPANPCGKVWSRAELEMIGELAQKHDLFIFTDEVYEYFLYDGTSHVSPGAIAGLEDRTISMFSLSKTYSITGWRLGYAVSKPTWSQMIGYMNDLVYVCAPAPLQMGAAKGLLGLERDYYDALKVEYVQKRDKLCGALAQVGLTPHVPQGAYYVLADSTRLGSGTSKERAMRLLRDTGVATVPGEAFYKGAGGEGLLRFCFAKTDEDLDAACERLRRLG
jgi:aminotransferase